MASKSGVRIFLDTSVIFAAVLSPSGGARKLFHLAAAGILKLVVNPDVLRECEEMLRRKAPASLPWLARLLEIGDAAVSPEPTRSQIGKAKKYVKYPPDARILAGAMQAIPDWFVTHDQEHFLKSLAASELAFKIGTPGELIQALKDRLRT